MRRASVIVVSAALVGGLAAPAAAGTETEKYESRSASAWWRTTQTIEPGVKLRTTWYVDAYDTNDYFGAWVYRSVARCTLVDDRRRCRTLEWSSGGTRRLRDGDVFTVDRQARAGELEVTVKLTTRNRDGIVSRKVPTRVSATFEGTGDLSTGRDTSTWTSECGRYHSTSTYRSREAVASATVGGTDLGDARGGYLSWSTYRVTYDEDDSCYY